MGKGKFGLLFVDEEGNVFPAYAKNKEDRETIDFLVRHGMFGDTIIIDRNNQIGKLAKNEEE